MKKEADDLEAFAMGKTEDELIAGEDFQAIASAGNFRYSLPLGAGLLTLMPMVGVEPGKEAIERWCTELRLPPNRLQSDRRFFLDSQKKLTEVQEMMNMMAESGERKQAEKQVSKLKEL